MAEKYEYQQHPHAQVRAERGPAVAKRKAAKLTINERIGLVITRNVGSMWAAYLFALLSLVSLPAAIASQNTIIIVSWVAQTFLQLVLLPVIIVGQNIQAKAADQRAIATYEDAGAILEESREIQAHLGDQDKALNLLVEKVRVLEEQIAKQLKK